MPRRARGAVVATVARPLVSIAGCYDDPTESSNDVRGRYIDRHADTFSCRTARAR